MTQTPPPQKREPLLTRPIAIVIAGLLIAAAIVGVGMVIHADNTNQYLYETTDGWRH